MGWAATIIAIALVAMLAIPLHGGAQSSATQTARIGILWGGASSPALVRELEDALQARGWVSGQNLVIEQRAAEGRHARLPELAAELLRARISVALTSQSPATIAVKKASGAIPIVMLGNGDPVKYGLVSNLARPEANVTGLSFLVDEVNVKVIELLKEAAPHVTSVAVFVNPTNPGAAPFLAELASVAPRLGMTFRPVRVSTVEELEQELAALARDRPDAVFLVPEAFIGVHRQRIIDFATQQRWPAVGPVRSFVDAGALLSYGPDVPTIYRRAGIYVDKLLRGARPADLPVEQPSKFDMALNLKAARMLGLAVPPALRLRADHIIE